MLCRKTFLISTLNRFFHQKKSVVSNELNFKVLKYESKVPAQPIETSESFKSPNEKFNISADEIALLERLSLVDLDSKQALKTLEDSIEFASKILSVDTESVKEPLYTVLENYPLTLREDKVTDGGIKKDILKNAVLTEEEYFVAPPGNIALDQEKKKFD